ncbi:Nucleotide-binding universal stress protein, UspA family [Nakamurella panacisegetis]|uniref:Nucleotide-binding universal stress protein, UspA family n=1 Tax=Nakamurella panacisegetis TaxID=1090615 RepID=A0A1H0S8Z5_9ACTN|nr:universal stress protein [Nakamurella panacisegetis]SDP38243.1 Nucleotide-binding universal stress protein, UspA family [Nakamurella panacisegetis]
MSGYPDNQVVVGIDGSACALDAARWAAGAAVRRRAELTLLLAYDVSVGFAGPGVMIAPDVYTDVRHWAQQVLTDAAEAIRAQFPELTVSTLLRRGNAARVLIEATGSALLTVLGSHGDSEWTEAVLGSVAARVAAHGRGPVVVLRDVAADNPSNRPVWVGVEGSDLDAAPLAFALQEASLRQACLVPLHCWGEEPGVIDVPYYSSEAADQRRQEREQRLLAEQLTGWADKYPDVPVLPTLLHGHPATQILHRYQQVPLDARPSLIVVGSRGRSAIAGLLLGSTSHTLIAHSPCPVAVVRTRPDRP